MRQRLGFILTIVAIILVLVVINSISYVSEEQKPDSEFAPNRSTYHAGPTGTRALYDLLSESGYGVMRWRETPEKLLTQEKIKTFVIVGQTKLAIEQDEASQLLHWVSRGGRLVIVHRRPEQYLLPASGNWIVTTQFSDFSFAEADPAKPEEMTANVKAVSPGQPTLLTQNVETVMPSRFAAAINFAIKQEPEDEATDKSEAEEQPSPVEIVESKTTSAQISAAPVVHIKGQRGPLLIDYPYGAGRIVLLTDPYLVSNGGIGLQDNLALAINVVSSDGLIAFDEYHQGRGTTSNALISYFSGTPVLALCGQVVLIILLLLWTRGRRFARPLPLARVDRRSSLEFVASMAEVQQRARAFDLAVENIYSRTRRVLARYAGVDYNSPRTEIAARVGSRSSVDAHQLEVLMRQCEEAINGQPITERQSILLVRRLREVEAKLGLRMRSREARQAAQNI